jgi:hypothetical protein
MKRIVIVSCVLVLFAGIAFAGAWRNYEDYQSYKGVRQAAMDAETAGDTANAVANFMKAEELAEKSADSTIKGWPLNNGAYALITKFKTAVGYAEKLAKLEGMSPSKEKLAYQKEMAELFNMQLPLLDEAKTMLEQGKGLGEEISAAKTIQSNLDFIAWVTEFTNSNINGATAEAKTPEQETAKEEVTSDAKTAPKAEATIIKPIKTK